MDILNVIDTQGQKVGEVAVSKKLLECHANRQLLHDVIVGYQRNQRQGNASTLTKGEVRGSGIKPWRQKGTGRARAGYRSSPVWRGGGVVFGPKPREYARVIPKELRRRALAGLFAEKVRSGQAVIVDRIEAPGAKTKAFAQWLQKIKAGKKPLIIVSECNQDLARASRNIPGAAVVTGAGLNAWLLAAHENVVIAKSYFESLQEKLA